LWLNQSTATPLQNDQEVIVKKFTFTPMSGINNASFSSGSLSGWSVSGPGTARIAQAPQDTTNGVCELITGSPISLIQNVDTLSGAADLLFDYQFTTTTGSLDVFLGGQLLGSVQAPGTLAGDWTTLDLPIGDPNLWNLTGAELRFTLDGSTGSRMLLDNVEILGQPTPEPSTIVLLGIGALGLLGWAWRRRRS
jgi:hypothetical protein